VQTETRQASPEVARHVAALWKLYSTALRLAQEAEEKEEQQEASSVETWTVTPLLAQGLRAKE
jgi:hypothetical protein